MKSMKFNINIDCPPEKMEASLKRMQARTSFEYADRVPVNFCVEPRYVAPILGVEYDSLFKDPAAQYDFLLKMAKWTIENLDADNCCGPAIMVAPYFDNVKQASAFGCEVVSGRNETLQSIPFMRDPSEIENMRLPAPTDGLFGKYIDWYLKFEEFIKDTKIIFGKTEGQVIMAPMTLATLSPHMVATDIAGTEIYLWMHEEPKLYHEMLDKITQNSIECEHYVRKLKPFNWGGFGLAEDTSTIISPQMYKEMVAPYTLRMYNEFGRNMAFGRGMHMCGPSAHLLSVLADEIKITDFNVFGFPVKPADAAEKMGGKVALWGNINPMLMQTGTKKEVKAACAEALSALAPCGGFMLGDGANIAPGTPVENVRAFAEAAAEYGKPCLDPRYIQKRNYEYNLER